MTEEIKDIVDEYLDRFLSSDIILIKIKDQNYPINTMKRIFLERIKEREIDNVSAYIFLNDLFIEKI